MHLPAADRNLIKSGANRKLEVPFAPGCKLQLSLYHIIFLFLVGFYFFLAGGGRPPGQALRSSAHPLCISVPGGRVLPEPGLEDGTQPAAV